MERIVFDVLGHCAYSGQWSLSQYSTLPHPTYFHTFSAASITITG